MKQIWIRVALCLAAIVGTLWAYLGVDWDFYNASEVSLKCPLPSEQASKSEKPFRFIAFGDFGADTLFQKRLADVMGRVYQQTPFQTALLLGDNIYPNGDVAKLAESHFEKPYRYLIAQNVRFIAALGNHDTKDHHEADSMRYFGMPSPYYKATQGPVDFFVLNTINFKSDPIQRDWLEKELSDSKAPWKIVMAHHPMISSGRYYGKDKKLTAQLLPVLKRYHVDFYLNGHEHLYERFKPQDGLQMVTSGGGGAYLYQFKKKPIPESVVRFRKHHFLLFEILGNQVTMRTINQYGQIIDCLHFTKNSNSIVKK
jgi:Calcineurin-like phosphoesterase